jgi:hypothetical protein
MISLLVILFNNYIEGKEMKKNKNIDELLTSIVGNENIQK